MDLEDIVLSENQTEKDKYHMTSLICISNEQNRNRLIDTENRWTVVRWEGGWVEKVKGLSSTNCLLQNSHRDVDYIIRNTVNIVIIMYGARRVLEAAEVPF